MTASPSPVVSGRQRALAWMSIACAVVLAVVLIVFSLSNLLALLAVVLGLAVAVAGAWWLVTEHPPRRWFGLIGALVGLAIIVAAVFGAADQYSR